MAQCQFCSDTLNGTLVSNIVIDTTQMATDTIDYVATDTWGNTATSTRLVIIEADATASSAVQWRSASRMVRWPLFGHVKNCMICEWA